MNQQEIYNTVRDHLLSQKSKALSPSGSKCMYRGALGTKCAIGCLLPDEIATPELDSIGSVGLILHTVGPNSRFTGPERIATAKAAVDFLGLTEDNHQFFAGLQTIHDGRQPWEWADALASFALSYNLIP